MQTQIQDNIVILRNLGIHPSLIRLKVLQYLKTHKTHPTVDEIFSSLKPSVVTLSKTSVYNTLDLFLQHGLVISININDNETRYDYDTSTHGHFLCNTCRLVYDFQIKAVDYAELSGFEIDKKDVYFFGKCFSCKSAENLKEGG